MKKYLLIAIYLLLSNLGFGQDRPYVVTRTDIILIDSIADFSFTKFNSLADFSGVKFNSNAYFYGAEFDYIADFSFTKFNSLADFSGVKFNSNANFNRTKFDSIANFNRTKFDSLADFSGVYFNSNAYFDNINFSGKVSFSGSSFRNGSFENTIFTDTVYFQDVNISGIVDFSKIKMDSLSQGAYINLEGSDIKNILFDYSKFRLFFSNNTSQNEKDRIYIELKSNVKKESYGYQLLDIEHKESRYSRSLGSYVIGFLDKWWWNYGYNKQLIVANTFRVLLFFWILNALFFNFLNKNVYEIQGIWKEAKKFRKYRIMSRLFYSFLYTCLIFFGLKITFERMKYHSKLGVIYFFLQFTSGLIFAATLANIIIKS